MITIIYRALVAIVLFFTIWNLYEEEDLLKQVNHAWVVIPLILRVLMIK